jgi:Raf kinase inhibitor-like YbhB/YbcL family protein
VPAFFAFFFCAGWVTLYAMSSTAFCAGGTLSRLLSLVSMVAGVGCSSGESPAPGASGSAGTPSGGTPSGGNTTGGAGSGGVISGGAAGNAGANSGGTSGGGAGASAGASNGGSGGASGGPAAGGSGGGSAGSGGVGGSSGGGAGGAAGSGSFTITSPAFANQPGCAQDMAASCATFPRDMTNYGDNLSPAMSWTGAPAGTQSFAVLLQDLTNSNSHWVLWNIPASVTSLAENVPKGSAMPATPQGSQQCSIGSGDGYFGPGACGNVYEFVVYALSAPTFSPTMPTNQTMVRQQLLALGNGILGKAAMRGRSFAPNCP